MRIVRAVLFMFLAMLLITPSGLAQEATPSTAAAGSFQERFLSLANSMPDWLDRDEISVHYADLAWRAEFVGFDPAASTDGFISASVGIGMALPPSFAYAAFFPALGFTSTQVSRTLVLDAVIDKITLMNGDFDHAAMETALLESGYVAEEIGGVPTFVLGGDDYQELGTDAGSIAISGKTQYVVLLADDLIGFTNKRAFAEEIVAAHSGESGNLSENADLERLIGSVRSDLVSVQIWPVASLGDEIAAGEAAGELPPFRWILFGDSDGTGWSTGVDTVESEADAASVIVLLMDDAGQADAALEQVPARFDAMSSVLTGAPYSELLTLKSAESGASADIAVFEFDVPIIGRIAQMWQARDLGFIYPG